MCMTGPQTCVLHVACMMQAMGIRPTTQHGNALVRGFAITNRPFMAGWPLQLVTDGMLGPRCRPDTNTFNAIMEVQFLCKRTSFLPSAYVCCDLFCTAGWCNGQSMHVTYQLMMSQRQSSRLHPNEMLHLQACLTYISHTSASGSSASSSHIVSLHCNRCGIACAHSNCAFIM